MSEPAVEPAQNEPDLPAMRRVGGPILAVAGVLLLALVIGVAATPFWAPTVMRLLPWGAPSPAPPAPQDPALTARLTALEAARGDQAKTATALQQLTQRIAGLEAKPLAPTPPAADLTPVQQQLAALSKAVADLNAIVAGIEAKPPAPAPAAADPGNTALALALVLLQIREAVDVARPFKPEYEALLALARNHPDIAAATAPLEGPATAGVASRAALIERLRQLAPQIATAAPPADPGWWGQITGPLRSLVTIRRIDGSAQTAEEAAVNNAQRALGSGDLAGAIAALDGLSGPAKATAEPWLRMARDRLAVEATLRRIEALMTAQLGGAGLAIPGTRS
jgi:hypothetical protein